MVSASQWAYLAFVAAVAVERLVELRISKRNAAWAFERGGVEAGQGHFTVMKILHTAFLLAAPAEVLLLDRPFPSPWGWVAAGAVLATMGLRYWAIATLGVRWNTRVIVVPGLAAVNAGPYRYLRHPNYLAVIVELAALPLVHGAWITALSFTVANAALLRVRIRCEEQALRTHCAYEDRLGDRRGLVPGPAGEAHR
ncbi:MAG: isoprenylcysteine carboxyl methyltransferase family protein [Myxococcales bacterium]|nr:isoprenylcysteine carboxyl methyltransferase family protein [Myxococcales bacterium]